jgi:hypothetical protein
MANQQRRPATPPEGPLFVTWLDPKVDKGVSQQLAFASANKALQNHDCTIQRATATNIFQNIAPGNVSIREGMSRRDYEMFRPGEQTPKRTRDVIAACQNAYDNIGIIRQVIDLMGDFACKGVDVVHPNPTIEKFYRNWFKRVRGPERTERFLNTLYRLGNVIIRRTMAKLSKKDQENIQKGVAGQLPIPNMDAPEPRKVDPRRIPMRYTIMNPLFVEVLGEDLAPFIGEDGFMYALRVESNLAKLINSPKGKTNVGLVSQIPSNIKQMIREGQKLIPLPSEQIEVFHYKKDDWQVWASPLIKAILPDLRMYEKMKLADLVALDGAISHIRLWRLGNLEHKLLPTDAAVGRLATMLLNNVGGGAMDLIWGPDLELQETGTEVHRFLGEMKYAPILAAIYAGLGIPSTLTGDSSGGFTNNFVSLRTIIERLEYGRGIVKEFWEGELKLVQQAFNFRLPAQLVFEQPALTDESALLALLLQLVDRDLISMESVIDRFGFMPGLEKIRLKREYRDRENGNLPPKASPFHVPTPENDLKKIALQSGQATPSEVGLELDERAAGEKPLMQHEADITIKQQKMQMDDNADQRTHDFKLQKLQLQHGVHPGQLAVQQGAAPGASGKTKLPKTGSTPGSSKPKGVSGQGRPKNSKDGSKRKQKRVVPRSKAAEINANLMWAKSAQKIIADVVHPIYLQSKGKKTLRSLTEDEANKLEKFKFAVLCHLSPEDHIDEDKIKATVAEPLPISEAIAVLYDATLEKYHEQFNTEPSTEDLRHIQASVCALWHCDYEEDYGVEESESPTEESDNGESAS